jgi:hypothetical protein
MNFERISFKKWGTVHPTPPPPQKAQALATCKGLQNMFFKRIQKNLLYRRRPAASGRPLVATLHGRCPSDRWSPGQRSATPNQRSPAPDQRSPTAPVRVPHLCDPCPLRPTSLPPNFLECGQFFLIGCSTCPPCLNFSLKLQTSITFDPLVQNMHFFSQRSLLHVHKKFQKI